METIINWLEFFSMIPFVLIGVFIHILGKYVLAKKKPGYTFGEFILRNYWAWIMGLIYSLLGCYFFIRGLNPIPGVTWDVFGLISGIGLGSLGKTTIKLFSSKKS